MQTKKEKAQYHKNWRKKNPNYAKNYYKKHSEQPKKYQQENQEQVRASSQKWKLKNPNYIKKYFKSEKGKQASAKMQAKRKRELGWILMFENPFANNEKIDYHHITDVYVVAVPKDLHRLYLGKQHREKTMEIVKQIYLGD